MVQNCHPVCFMRCMTSIALPDCLSLGPGLGLEGLLHGVERLLVRLADGVELVLLLLDPTLDLLLHLRQLQLRPQDLRYW